MLAWIVSQLNHHGLLAVWLLMMIESLGVPLPSEVIMPLGGALASAFHWPLALVPLVGTIGELMGASLAYGLAYRFGPDLLTGPGGRLGIRASQLEAAHRWFARWGSLTAMVGRCIPGLRSYVSYPAGAARMGYLRFLVFTAIGCAIWNTSLAIAGFELKSQWSRAAQPLQALTVPGIVVLLVLLIAAWYLSHRRISRTRAS